MSITFDTIQQAIVDSEVKYISWLFDMDTYSPDATYYWSTKTKSFKDYTSFAKNDYTFKIIPESFAGITLNRAKPDLGVQIPGEITFEVTNQGETLTASDFTGNAGYVLVRLVASKHYISELMTNTGFETYTGTPDDAIGDTFTGWTVSGTDGYVDASQVSEHGGSTCIKIRSGATADRQIKQTVTVTAQEHYSFSFFAKTGGTLNLGRHAVYDNSNGAWIIVATSNVGNTSDTVWSYLKYDFTTPVGCTSIDLILLCDSTASKNVFYDDVSLTYAEMELRSWAYSITKCESAYQSLYFTCESVLQRYIKGDYPKKGLVKNLFKSNNNLIQDNYCLPESFGTAYIPLRIVLSAVDLSLTNGGFETYVGSQDDGVSDTFTNWSTIGSGLTEATATVHGGTNAVKLTGGASFDRRIFHTFAANLVIPNSIMEVKFWTRGDGTYAGRYGVYDATNSAWIISATSTGITGTAYTQKSVTFIVPDKCIGLIIYFYCPAVNGGIAYFDDVILSQIREFYLLGPTVNTAGAAVTYEINAQRVPRGQLKSKEEYRSGMGFTLSTIVDDSGTNRKVFINNISNTEITDWTANATFGSNDGEHFYDVPTEFTRSDRTSTDPEDIINDIFNDLKGADYGILDPDSLTSAGTTYDSWGLDWNGGLWEAKPTEKVIGTLLNMCHSTIVLDGLYAQLQVLSKTSQKTITKAEVLRTSEIGNGTFKYTSLTKEIYNSGYVAYQVLTEAQDELIQLLVPMSVGGSTSTPSSEILELPFINDDIEAQKLGILYFQRIFDRIAEISFSAKATCLALQPDDVITINHADYGGNYAVLIDSITIKRDLTLDFKCIRFGHALSDWADLSAVTAILTVPIFKQLERNLSSMNQMFMERFQL